MDPIRVERLAWAIVFAAVVALVVAFALVPDGTGVPRVVVAAVVFVITGALAARLARNTPRAKLGDQTILYVVFFLVAASGQAGLAALGYEGVGPRLAAFAAGWLVASRAKRLNPRRGGERPA